MWLTFESFWPLILRLIVPYLWWARRGREVDLTPKHLRLSTSIRSAIVFLIVLALMQPILYRASSYVSVVYLLDISQSVAPGAIKKAIEWIQQTNDAGEPDHAQFVAFGSNSMAVEKVAELKKVQVSSDGQPGTIDQR